MGCSNSYEPKVQTSKNSVPSYYNPIGDYTVKSQKLSPKKYYIFFKTPDPELFKLKKGFLNNIKDIKEEYYDNGGYQGQMKDGKKE